MTRYFRFLLMAPFILPVLALFALYHAGPKDVPVLKYLWALTVGLAAGLANPLFNLTAGTFIFWRLPPFRDEDGKFSIMFTTRIKLVLKETAGADPLARFFAAMVNEADPGHFRKNIT